MQLFNLNQMKDSELLERFLVIVKNERETIALLILHLSEIDKRKLYAKEGFSSLFSYCVEKFHFSEEAAYRRIQAARLSQKFPQILGLLEKGKINLTAINLISPHLTIDNKDQLLNEIQFKSKREVEKIIATHFPLPDHGKDIIRRLAQQNVPMESKGEMEEHPEVTFASEGSLHNHRAALTESASVAVSNMNQKVFQGTKKLEEIKPITANRVKIEFRADEPVAEMIERAKQLLRHKYPDGRLEDIFREVLELFLEKKDPIRKPIRRETLERKKTILKTRYISEVVRREVWSRDGGVCTYVSSHGRRCGERNFVQIDHVQPFALGGESTKENLRLLCRTHNQWRARQTFSHCFKPQVVL